MPRRLSAILLAGLLAGLAGSASALAPAGADVRPAAVVDACEAFDVTDPEAVIARAEEATDVFVGRVRAAEPIDGRRRGGAGDQEQPSGLEPEASEPASGAAPAETARRQRGWRHAVEVEIGFRGDPRTGDVVNVETRLTRDDGLGRLEDGGTYLFFARAADEGRALSASRCGGTTLLSDGLSARLRDQLEQILDPDPDTEPAEVQLTEPEGGTDAPPSLTRAAAPGVALALVGILGLLLFSRAGRSS